MLRSLIVVRSRPVGGSVEGEGGVEDNGEEGEGDQSEGLIKARWEGEMKFSAEKARGERRTGLTIVFQLMGSTKLLTTPANVSAPTLARPTTVGSRFMPGRSSA